MNQKGFIPILVVVVIVAITSITGGVIYLSRRAAVQQDSEGNSTSSATLESKFTIPSPTASLVQTPRPTQTPSSPSKTSQPKQTAVPTSQPKTSPSPTSAPRVGCGISTNIDGNSPTVLTVDPPRTVSFTTGPVSPYPINNQVIGAQWDFNGDGNWDTDMSAANQTTSYTFTQPGTYAVTARLKMSDSSISYSCSKHVTVRSPQVICEVHSNVTSGKAPLTVNFYYGARWTSSVNNDYVTNVQWDFDGNGTWDTSFDVGSQRPTHTYSSAGTYTVKMHLQTFRGLTSDVCTGTITVS